MVKNYRMRQNVKQPKGEPLYYSCILISKLKVTKSLKATCKLKDYEPQVISKGNDSGH